MTDKKLNYNPDVLNALANLSSDEVFTPPKIANQVLDLFPQELFSNPNITFLDPASKSGVFLREIAKRLIKGLEQKFPNLQDRLNHIFTKQLFGIAITELTALISRRTVYCSKKANSKYSVCPAFEDEYGNIYFDRIEHVWESGRCKFCGANQELLEREETLETYAYAFIHRNSEEFSKLFGRGDMEFDVIIGNPPYQLKDGGAQASATPIYHKFVEQAKKLNPRYLTMIIPSRWFNGGKGLDNFRKEMLKDKRIRVLVDYPFSQDIFPGVQIEGGVCYFLWDRNNPGKCKVISYKNGNVVSEMERDLLEDGLDVFIRYNKAISILKKVLSKNEKTFADIVSSRKPFGLPTNFSDFSKKPFYGSIKVYTNQYVGYINKEQVLKNHEWIDKYKIFISMAYGMGNSSPYQVINIPIVVDKKSSCTETYLLIGPFDFKKEAENACSYIKTKFFRFLVMLNKPTQHATQKVYKLVPMQDFSKPWTDEELYKKYDLTKS